jgi:hypothetical protein
MGRGSAGGGAATAARKASGGAKAKAAAAAGETFTGHERVAGRQFEAVRRYQEEGSHHDINATLRQQKAAMMHDLHREDVAHLDAAIDASRINRDTTVYRGFMMEHRPPSPSDLVGMAPVDPAFYSTSTSRVVSEGFAGFGKGILMRIKVPAGTKGLNVGKIDTGSSFSDKGATPEHEVLMARNTKVRITSVRATKKGLWVANAEIVK